MSHVVPVCRKRVLNFLKKVPLATRLSIEIEGKMMDNTNKDHTRNIETGNV